MAWNDNLIAVEEDIDNASTPWNITVDGYYKQKAEQQMVQDEMSLDAVDTIFANAVRILSHCPNPAVDRNKSETGIVIGKVQSGKTSPNPGVGAACCIAERSRSVFAPDTLS